MSYDLNITNQCNHLVYRELTPLSANSRELRFLKPVAATATIKAYASDNFIIPGMYEIREDALNSQEKVLVFKAKWRSITDYFEITYQTLSSYCSKCAGSNFLDDFQFDIRGSLQVVRDERLLMQNVEKWVITRINSNSFHSFVGSGLTGLIGTKIINAPFLAGQIKTEINRALQKFQDMQLQYKRTGRAMTQGEILASVENIDVRQDINDPTIIRANVAVKAASGKTLEFTQILRMR